MWMQSYSKTYPNLPTSLHLIPVCLSKLIILPLSENKIVGSLNENGPKDSCIRMLNPVSGTVWEGSGGVAFLVRGAGSLGVGLRGFKYSMPFPVSTLYSFSQGLPGKLLCTLSALCLWIRYKLSATAWAPCFPACMDSKLLIKYPPPAFLCNLGYTGTRSIDQASLEFIQRSSSLSSASQVLGICQQVPQTSCLVFITKVTKTKQKQTKLNSLFFIKTLSHYSSGWPATH